MKNFNLMKEKQKSAKKIIKNLIQLFLLSCRKPNFCLVLKNIFLYKRKKRKKDGKSDFY